MAYALLWWWIELICAGVLMGRYVYPLMLYGSYRFIYAPSIPWGALLVLCLSDVVWTGQWGIMLFAALISLACARLVRGVFDTSSLVPYIVVTTIFISGYILLKSAIFKENYAFYSTTSIVLGNVISGTIMVVLKYRKKHAGQSLFTKR